MAPFFLRASRVALQLTLILLCLVSVKQRLTRNVLLLVTGADPDPVQDFCVTDTATPQETSRGVFWCKSRSAVTAADFSSDVLATPGNASSSPMGFTAVLASAANVGGLNAQGLSFARVDIAQGGVVPPHIHPRAAELVYVIHGTLHAAFIDSTNRLFSKVLGAGELFVIPRGLVHFIYNAGGMNAVCVASFNSQNPGVLVVANALFGAHPAVDDVVLEKTFQLSRDLVEQLKRVHS